MAANQPATGREVLPAGIDVRTIRKPINEAFASVPIELIGEGAATSTDGRRMSFTVIPEDTFYIRLNTKTTVNGTIRYGWVAVNQDRDSGNWTNCVRAGNATTDDWATELNNTDLTVGTATRYIARVNPQTGRVTFFFRNRGNVPPVDPCVDGICTSPPSAITIIWPPAAGDYEYPGTFPNYGATPGYQCFYSDPNDPRFGALQWETVNGWTYHYPSFEQKIADIIASTVTVPTSLGNWLETEIDVTSDFTDIFPMFCDYKRYNGPTLFPDTTTPQLDFELACETNIIYAKRYVRVFMGHGGSCRMGFSVQQRLEISLESTWSETSYQFGPFGIPIGSTSLSGGTSIGGAQSILPGALCGPDGDDGVDFWNGYTGPDVDPQITGESYPPFEYTGFIDCGDSEISFALEPFDVLHDSREGLDDTMKDIRPASYIVQDNDQ